jgi:hypothetical protein
MLLMIVGLGEKPLPHLMPPPELAARLCAMTFPMIEASALVQLIPPPFVAVLWVMVFFRMVGEQYLHWTPPPRSSEKPFVIWNPSTIESLFSPLWNVTTLPS